MGGGTDLERGYGNVWSWRSPFHASPVVLQGSHFKQKSLQDPFWGKIKTSSLYSLTFCPNFSYQAPKFEHLSSEDLSFSGKTQFPSPTLQESGPHTPTCQPEKSWITPRIITNNSNILSII